MHHPVMAVAAAAALVFGAGSGIDRSDSFSSRTETIPAYTGWYCFQPKDARKSAGEYGPENVDELWSEVRLPLRNENRCRYESRLVLDPVRADSFKVNGRSQQLYRIALGTDSRGKPTYGYTTDIE